MNITRQYTTLNPCYRNNIKIRVKGLMLHSVGCAQPKASVFINQWNKTSAGVGVHGVLDANNAYLCLPCNEISGYSIKGWHGASGPNGSVNNTHIGFEMTEPSTIKYTGNGSEWIDLNSTETKKHVLATYNNAVELFAYLCEFHGLNPLQDGVIISHSEGNKRGIASNHGDVEHIWKKFGLTMNQFRQDVYNRMEDDNMTQEKFNEMAEKWMTELAKKQPSNWSATARDWAEKEQLVVGDAQGNKMYKKPLTREEAI